MRSVFKSAVFSMLVMMFLFQFQLTAFAVESDNPLIEPLEITEYAEASDPMINILLLGIDFGIDGYWGSGPKKDIEICHTDADMVVAINLDQKRIDLISLPRDTVTYVPGVRGIYKLNAAIHCAQTMQEGLQKTKHAAEWLLGNIKIDYFFAVDMGTMIAIGNAIGGVDMELEMSYRGSSSKWYKKGTQHLDGIGITDYLRARTNATVNYTDIGRTNRQRQTMLAIFKKLRNDEDAIWNLFDMAATRYDGFLTDITAADTEQLTQMMSMILSVDPETIGTHVLTGTYLSALDWNFTYTDQNNRLSVLEEVYGITAKPIPYISSQYAKWLYDTGFSTVHYISVSQQFMNYIDGVGVLAEEQKEAVSVFEAAYQEAVSTFDIAANSLSDSDTRAMTSAGRVLRDAADACAAALNYPEDLPWSHYRGLWWEDTYINEYQFNWR